MFPNFETDLSFFYYHLNRQEVVILMVHIEENIWFLVLKKIYFKVIIFIRFANKPSDVFRQNIMLPSP